MSQESLRNNETYRQISHMEEKLNDLVKDNKLLQRIVDELNEVKFINLSRILRSLKGFYAFPGIQFLENQKGSDEESRRLQQTFVCRAEEPKLDLNYNFL